MFSRGFTVSLAGMAVTAAAFGLAGWANASSVDDDFVAAVAQTGISVNNPQQVVTTGKNVCTALNRGTSANQIFSQLTMQYDLTTAQAKTFVVDSVQTYCPEHLQDS
ncbi:MAG: DUF732 domain-containing protein [Mycobacteriaceae bacterium]|nr:DUF732 domain-containing protein [Mycobacteriaceae bacterium]